MAIAAIRAPAGDRRASASRARLAEADRHLDRDPGPLVDAEPARGQQRRTTLGADRRSAADKAGKRSPHRRRRPVLPPTFLTALTAPARGVVLEWANAPAANQLPVRVPALLGKFKCGLRAPRLRNAGSATPAFAALRAVPCAPPHASPDRSHLARHRRRGHRSAQPAPHPHRSGHTRARRRARGRWHAGPAQRRGRARSVEPAGPRRPPPCARW